MVRSLVNVGDNNIPINSVNFSSEGVKFNKNMSIGVLHPVTSISEFSNGENAESICSINASTKNVGPIQVPEHLQAMVELAAENLSENDLEKFKRLIVNFQDAFTGPNGELGKTSVVEHSIHTGNTSPIRQKPTRIPIQQVEKVEKELDKLEA